MEPAFAGGAGFTPAQPRAVRRLAETKEGAREGTLGSATLYFATSMARLSRITITFTWPGYSS